jgi:splicing factor 3B subunit 1
LEDALMERDEVHRQTAMWAVKHLALGLRGQGAEDLLVHLLNFVWPNILEESPHVIQACFEAVEALRVALGPSVLLNYVKGGLWHPARRVREVYWRLYNNLYVYGGDALTPAYPQLPAEEVTGKDQEEAKASVNSNKYANTYLELMI